MASYGLLCMLLFALVDSEAACSSMMCTSRADVRSSSALSSAAVSIHVTSPRIGSGEIPHVSGEIPCITCDDVATATSVGRLSTLPPPTPHRGAVNQTTVTRANSLRVVGSSADRRCGSSNIVKRHSTSAVTTSPSSSCDSSQHPLRRSALLPPTWNMTSSDIHR